MTWTGLLEVSWERQETSRTKYVGRGRGGPESPQDDRMGRSLPDHDGAARRGGDRTTGWRGWAGRRR